MHFAGLTLASIATAKLAAAASSPHGASAQGTTMGPVAFLWPSDRPWSAGQDNTAPCGTAAGITNRTTFPLSQGSVSLSIADEAYNVAFSIAYDNNPTAQNDFQQQVVTGIAEVDPGHQCYKISQVPSDVTAGTNATIQLQYWSEQDDENSGNRQLYYACADITFVEAADFSIQIPCFNVTSEDFVAPSATASTTPVATGAAGTTAPVASSGGDGLSTGAKAGIAVGTIAASLAIVGVVAFMVLRRRKSARNEIPQAPVPKQPETASVRSAV